MTLGSTTKSDTSDIPSMIIIPPSAFPDIKLFPRLSGGDVSGCPSPNRGGWEGQWPRYSHSLARPQVGRPQLKTSIQSDQVDAPIPYRELRQVDTQRGEGEAFCPCGVTVRLKTDYPRHGAAASLQLRRLSTTVRVSHFVTWMSNGLSLVWG